MKEQEEPKIEVGQVWQDSDPNTLKKSGKQRQVEIMGVTDSSVYYRRVPDETQIQYPTWNRTSTEFRKRFDFICSNIDAAIQAGKEAYEKEVDPK